MTRLVHDRRQCTPGRREQDDGSAPAIDPHSLPAVVAAELADLERAIYAAGPGIVNPWSDTYLLVTYCLHRLSAFDRTTWFSAHGEAPCRAVYGSPPGRAQDTSWPDPD